MASRRTTTRFSGVSWAVLGVAFVAVYIVVFFYLMDRSSWDTWGAMLIGPVLFLVTLPALARQARREEDPRVFWFLVIALGVKMAASVFRYYHAFNITDKADARGYDDVGTQLALRFLQGDFHTDLDTLLDSNFIRLFTGIVYTVIRPSVVSGFLIYGWLAFWGTYFFYRAFVLAVPEGNRVSYRRWLFLMPSILFWPSSIGKESWMLFALGIAAFGAAKVLRERMIPGIVIFAVGLGLAALVRAPASVVLGLGLVVGGLLRRQQISYRQLKPVAKLASVFVFVGVAVVLAAMLNGFIDRSGRGEDVGAVFENALGQTSQGGSEFTPAPFGSPTFFVMAPVNVLYRPFIIEARTAEAVGTSIEASILLFLTFARIRSLGTAVRSLRRTPYVATAIVYVVGAIFALSAVANFGIIARQRTLIYPMFLVLLCLPMRPRHSKWRDRERALSEGSVPTLVGRA